MDVKQKYTADVDPKQITITYELDEKAKECHYIVDYYEVIDSDRFLDLILQDRRVKLSTEALRSMV